MTVDADGEVLQQRLAERAGRMWEGGLLDEVRRLLTNGLAEATTAARAVGYAQALAVLRGDLSVQDGIEETIRLTWRMVRRQRAWFGRDDGAIRVDGADPAASGVVLAALEAARTGSASI